MAAHPRELEFLLPDFSLLYLPWDGPSITRYEKSLRRKITGNTRSFVMLSFKVARFTPGWNENLSPTDDLLMYANSRIIVSVNEDLLGSDRPYRDITVSCGCVDDDPGKIETITVFPLDTFAKVAQEVFRRRPPLSESLFFLYNGHFLDRDLTIWDLGIASDELVSFVPHARVKVTVPGICSPAWFVIKHPPVDTIDDVCANLRTQYGMLNSAIHQDGEKIETLEDLYRRLPRNANFDLMN
jgi:hypothetical protein